MKGFSLQLCLFLIAMTVSHSLSLQESDHTKELNQKFERKQGWLGGDGVYSVPLGKKRAVFLFGDTWMGRIEGNRRKDVEFKRNTIGLFEWEESPSVDGKVYYPEIISGRDSFLPTGRNDQWYWFYHGAKTESGLQVFLMKIGKTGGEGLAGFELISNDMWWVFNPEDSPENWNSQILKVPHSKFTRHFKLSWGVSVLKSDEYYYIYGLKEVHTSKGMDKSIVLARSRELSDFDAWEFYSWGKYTKDPVTASPVLLRGADELSVVPSMDSDGFLVIWNPNSLNRSIHIARSETPEGPFSNSMPLYTNPEWEYAKEVVCYAAKAHPWYYQNSKLLVSYACNTTDLFGVLNDSRLYWPRFLDLSTHGEEK